MSNQPQKPHPPQAPPNSLNIASLETEQSRRSGCTLTLPALHGIIDVSKCREE